VASKGLISVKVKKSTKEREGAPKTKGVNEDSFWKSRGKSERSGEVVLRREKFWPAVPIWDCGGRMVSWSETFADRYSIIGILYK
jgi:hypothetical protein